MKSDLIDKKALIEALENWCGKQRYLIPEEVWDIIQAAPIFDDKEKIIEELTKRRNSYDINEEPKTPLDVSECADIREHKGMRIAYNEAIKIVKKDTE